MATISKVWGKIENPNPAIDAYDQQTFLDHVHVSCFAMSVALN